MDVLYIKSQLAWAAQNMTDAQVHIDQGDNTSVANDLDFADRAIERVREELRKVGTHA
jgi:hypothetical protein